MALTNGKYTGGQLSITIATVEYNMELTDLVLDNEPADNSDATFVDIGAGGALLWFFSFTANADYGTATIWDYIWTNAGATGVAFLYKPYGGAASTSKPHFSGTLKVGAKPGSIGGTAGETFKFEGRFDVTGTPTRVTA